jgi:hypothetical protein
MLNDRHEPVLEDPHAKLERALIREFLLSVGHDFATLKELPESQRQELLKKAMVYAAAKLTEAETRAHFLHEIHGTRAITPRSRPAVP